MTTVGNPHLEGQPGESYGNALIPMRLIEESVTDPTLGNGDGTYSVDISGARTIEDTDDVVGVDWSGSQKVTVDSVSGSSVTVLFESASGTDSYTNEADGSLSGTLNIRVRV